MNQNLASLLEYCWKNRVTALKWSTLTQKLLTEQNVEHLIEIFLKSLSIGPIPSEHLISYLKHALSTGLIPSNLFLIKLCEYDDSLFEKPLLFREFLELINTFIPDVMKKKVNSVLVVIKCTLLLLQSIQHVKNNSSMIKTRANEILINLIKQHDTRTALLSSKDEYPEEWKKFKKFTNLQNNPQLKYILNNFYLSEMNDWNGELITTHSPKEGKNFLSISFFIQDEITTNDIHATLFDHSSDRLDNLRRIRKLDLSRFYFELWTTTLRFCNENNNSLVLKSFLNVKIPKLIKHWNNKFNTETNCTEKSIELLSNYPDLSFTHIKEIIESCIQFELVSKERMMALFPQFTFENNQLLINDLQNENFIVKDKFIDFVKRVSFVKS